MEEEPKEFQKQINLVKVDDCKLVRTFPTRNGAIILFILGLVPTCLNCAMAPAYLLPLLNPPKARLVFIGTLLWHGFGCYLFARTRGRTPKHALYRIIIVLFYTIPFIVWSGLGAPAGSNFPADQKTWGGAIYNGWLSIYQ